MIFMIIYAAQYFWSIELICWNEYFLNSFVTLFAVDKDKSCSQLVLRTVWGKNTGEINQIIIPNFLKLIILLQWLK